MARPSPGRSRTVIRSVAAWRLDSGVVAPGRGPFDSNKARMAISANADSENPLLAANCAKRSFSASAGRAVMDGLRGVGLLSFMECALKGLARWLFEDVRQG